MSAAMKNKITLQNNYSSGDLKKLQRYANGESASAIRGHLSKSQYNKQGGLLLEKSGCHTITRAVVICIHYSLIDICILKQLYNIKLTGCEKQVLQLYADGYDGRDITKIRTKPKNNPLSINTINAQRESIKKKLRCKSIIRAVVLGIHYKLIEIRWVDE